MLPVLQHNKYVQMIRIVQTVVLSIVPHKQEVEPSCSLIDTV